MQLEDIFINDKIWKTFTDGERAEYIDKVFHYYKEIRGFPYYEVSLEQKHKDFQTAKKYLKRKDILVDCVVRQTMHLLGTINSYFPEMWEVQCHNQLTPKDVFDDDELFRTAIERRLKYGTYMSDSGIRKAIKRFPNTQGVSNFRPTASYAIYENFCPDNAVVWDMCSGWGGRFMGAMLSTKVRKYIGTDVEQYVFDAHVEMKRDFESLRPIELQMLDNDYPSEEVDLCFTSPPYFDTEKYGESENQSFRQFTSQESWLNDFMGTMIKRCRRRLSSNGSMFINIANVKGYPTLQSDLIYLAIQNDFQYIDTLKLSLSNINKGGFKYEPIFHFKPI